MKRFINFFLFLLTIVYLLLATSSFAYAQEPEEWRLDHCFTRESVDGQEIEVATIQGFECIFTNVVRILTPVAGLAVFIMLVVGSFQLITAGGEPKQVQKARKTLTSAILGLFIFAGIFLVLKLIQAITGVDVTKFEIPGPTPAP